MRIELVEVITIYDTTYYQNTCRIHPDCAEDYCKNKMRSAWDNRKAAESRKHEEAANMERPTTALLVPTSSRDVSSWLIVLVLK